MSKYKTIPIDLVCLSCGNVNVIQRKIGNLKKQGHIKTMYCPFCKTINQHYEVRDVSSFIYKYAYSDYNTLDNNTKKVLDMLMEREDNCDRGENRVFKKILTRR